MLVKLDWIVTYLAQLLALVSREKRSQTLESGIDALHASPLVAVGDFPAHPLLAVHKGFSRAVSIAQGPAPASSAAFGGIRTAHARLATLRTLMGRLAGVLDVIVLTP